ncbi:hypothetical protein HpBGD49_16390 [Helicobacter pylori]
MFCFVCVFYVCFFFFFKAEEGIRVRGPFGGFEDGYRRQEGENLNKDLKILEKEYLLANQELEKAKIILEMKSKKKRKLWKKKSGLFWTKTP